MMALFNTADTDFNKYRGVNKESKLRVDVPFSCSAKDLASQMEVKLTNIIPYTELLAYGIEQFVPLFTSEEELAGAPEADMYLNVPVRIIMEEAVTVKNIQRYKEIYFMLMEVYYEHYAEKCNDAYWEEEKILPYMVLERDKEKREEFKTYLLSIGYRCCTWNDYYPGVLVNTRFKRFALIHRACNFSHVENKNYSIEEFKEKILGNQE